MSLICVVACSSRCHGDGILQRCSQLLLTLTLPQILGWGICIWNHQQCLPQLPCSIHFTKYPHLFLPPFPHIVITGSRTPFPKANPCWHMPPSCWAWRAGSRGKIYCKLHLLALFKNPCLWKSVVERAGYQTPPSHLFTSSPLQLFAQKPHMPPPVPGMVMESWNGLCGTGP